MTYTFILHYRGGTYIEQITAPDVLKATFIWAERTANDVEIEHLDGQAFRQVFKDDIGEFPPTPIDERANVWHLFFFSGRNRMDVHIIKTSNEEEPFSAVVGVRANDSGAAQYLGFVGTCRTNIG